MGKSGEWADHTVVVATAIYLQREIWVIKSSPDTKPNDAIEYIKCPDAHSGDPLLVGHIWESHYVSLSPVDDN